MQKNDPIQCKKTEAGFGKVIPRETENSKIRIMSITRKVQCKNISRGNLQVSVHMDCTNSRGGILQGISIKTLKAGFHMVRARCNSKIAEKDYRVRYMPPAMQKKQKLGMARCVSYAMLKQDFVIY